MRNDDPYYVSDKDLLILLDYALSNMLYFGTGEEINYYWCWNQAVNRFIAYDLHSTFASRKAHALYIPS